MKKFSPLLRIAIIVVVIVIGLILPLCISSDLDGRELHCAWILRHKPALITYKTNLILSKRLVDAYDVGLSPESRYCPADEIYIRPSEF